MQQFLQPSWYMLHHDPLVVVGFLLLAISASFFCRIILAMEKAGYAPAYLLGLTFEVPFEYLKVRAERGWSPWPVYSFWLCSIAGIATLIAGLFRLSN